MNKVWHCIQEFLILKIVYPVFLKYVDDYLITDTDEMQQAKIANDLPDLSSEYQQLSILKFIYSILFDYIHNHLIDRQTLITQCQSKNNLFQLDHQEIIQVDSPIYEGELLPMLEAKRGVFEFTTPFAAVVENVELFGLHGIGFTETKKIILETSLDREDCLRYSLIQTFKQGFDRQYIMPVANLEKIDLACSLVNYWSHLYSHWILENLTRLEALEHYSAKTGKQPILIINPNPPKWQIRSLELMGYPVENCWQWNGRRTKVKELVICSKRRQTGRTSIKACHWLRERIISNIEPHTSSNLVLSPNVFISRKKANSRRILNEQEVIDCLGKMNFVTYVLEDIDWEDQVKIFAQAEIIVAPHGAGVCNMIFATKKAIVIEIFARKISHAFYALAQGLGFKYGYILGQAIDENIIVNCQELECLIQRMLK